MIRRCGGENAKGLRLLSVVAALWIVTKDVGGLFLSGSSRNLVLKERRRGSLVLSELLYIYA